MNAQQIKVYNYPGPVSSWLVPFVKMATAKNTLEFRQVFLIIRIIISIFTIGMIGYRLERIMQLIQK